MPPPPGGFALELLGIQKRFGDAVALDSVSLSILPGEIFALVGENGAGKTTLMNVAYGLYRPDAGQVKVKGHLLELRSPADALAAGIGMVHQHFMLVGPLSVAENVVLGREPRRRGQVDRAAASAAVAATSQRLGFALDPQARVESLSVGAQQRVEIVKAIHRGAEILILDEPTAVLTPSEAEELLGICRKLRAEGRTVILITHKLKEVMALADRVGVMVRGRLTRVMATRDATRESLAAEMIPVGVNPEAPPENPGASTPGPVELALRAVSCGGERGNPILREIDLEVHQGEVVGIAGVAGNGQSELAEVIAGLRPISAGSLKVAGTDASSDIARRRAAGLAHIPEDRQGRGLCATFTVEENAALGHQAEAPFAHGIWIDFAGRRRAAEELISKMDVRPPVPTALARNLSGGNQQKVVVGRELRGKPRVVVAVQPTHGLDIGATANVHRRLREARAAGAAVLLISMDLDEVLALSDRVAVIFEGRLSPPMPIAEAGESRLGRMMLGQSPA